MGDEISRAGACDAGDSHRRNAALFKMCGRLYLTIYYVWRLGTTRNNCAVVFYRKFSCVRLF